VKFLCDHDVYAATVRVLRSLGHEAAAAAELELAQAEDTEILSAARAQGRILVTRDRDFGRLVFVQHSSSGVVYLRMSPSTTSSVHAELERILTLYSERDLAAAFVVVEPGRHRIRKLHRPSSS
jgi:predicted nuclease of predicted toxin-antitoxin system